MTGPRLTIERLADGRERWVLRTQPGVVHVRTIDPADSKALFMASISAVFLAPMIAGRQIDAAMRRARRVHA